MAENKFTPSINQQLFLLIAYGDIEGVNRLVTTQNADIYTIDLETYETLLHTAATHNQSKAIEWLVKNQHLDVNATDYYGQTPAHTAAIVGNVQTIMLLKKCGANLSLTNHDGFTVREILKHYHPDLLPTFEEAEKEPAPSPIPSKPKDPTLPDSKRQIYFGEPTRTPGKPSEDTTKPDGGKAKRKLELSEHPPEVRHSTPKQL